MMVAMNVGGFMLDHVGFGRISISNMTRRSQPEPNTISKTIITSSSSPLSLSLWMLVAFVYLVSCLGSLFSFVFNFAVYRFSFPWSLRSVLLAGVSFLCSLFKLPSIPLAFRDLPFQLSCVLLISYRFRFLCARSQLRLLCVL